MNILTLWSTVTVVVNLVVNCLTIGSGKLGHILLILDLVIYKPDLVSLTSNIIIIFG